jgi:hypothetical protein
MKSVTDAIAPMCRKGAVMYHPGNRELQDRFDSRRIADRLVEVLHRVQFTDDDRAFIESRPLFFLATADAAGAPDCSYKGGRPGFVRVVATIDAADPLRPAFEGAQLVVRVRAEHIFPNCPRYIHRMQVEELSPYAPAPGHVPPVPAWKQMDAFRDYLPREASEPPSS